MFVPIKPELGLQPHIALSILILVFVVLLFRLLAKLVEYRRMKGILLELRMVHFIVEEKKSATVAVVRLVGEAEENSKRESNFEPEGILAALELNVLYSMSVYRNQPLWIAPVVSGNEKRPTVEDDIRRVILENRDVV